MKHNNTLTHLFYCILNKKNNFLFFIFFVNIVISNKSFAQKFYATCNVKEVPQNYTFDITYTCENAEISNFKPPKITDFDIYGPSTSQNVSIVNGKMSKSKSFTYTLQPKKQGDFTISAATAKVNGTDATSNTIHIKVIAPQKKQQQQYDPFDPFGAMQQQRSQREQVDETKIQDFIKKRLFVNVTPSKTTIYEGEQTTLSYKIYAQLENQMNVSKMPSYNGFLSEEFKLPEKQEYTKEKYNNQDFYTLEFRRITLFPNNKSGKITIEPMEFQSVVAVPIQDWVFVDYQQFQYNFKSNTIDINVLPLPEKNKPKNFSGAVGKYTFTANYDKTKAKINEPIKLTVTFNGTGNLKLINAPKLEFPEEMEAYEPKIIENFANNGNVVVGFKTFEYILVPQDGGKFEMPDFEFAYFDVDKKDYVIFKMPKTTIEVEGKALPSVNLFRRNKKEKIDNKKNEIYSIKTGKIITYNNFANSTKFYIITLGSIFLIIFAFIFRKREISEFEILALRRKKANNIALKRLAIAKKMMQKNEEKQFYNEVIRALWEYLSFKLHIPTSTLSKENIEYKLAEKNLDIAKINTLKDTLENCEMALFAPVGKKDKMTETFNNAVELISDIEQQLKV